MYYKTIVFQLLEQHPELYDQLRRQRQVYPALDHYACELKSLHEAWVEMLLQAAPTADPIQIVTEALELALMDLVERLPATGSPVSESEPLSFDGAMAFIHRHMPTA